MEKETREKKIKDILGAAAKKIDSWNFKEIRDLVEKRKIKMIVIIPLSSNITKSILEKLIDKINKDLLLHSLNISAFPYFLPIEKIKIPKISDKEYVFHKAIHNKLKQAQIYLEEVLIYGIVISENTFCSEIPFDYGSKIKGLFCDKNIKNKMWINKVASSICVDVAWSCGVGGYIPFFSVPEKEMYDYIKKKYHKLFTKIAIRLSIDELNSFSKVIKIKPQEVKDLVPIKEDEKKIKTIIREILGEPFDQKDWAGEQSDLFTIQMKYKKKSLRAAFLLKGWKGVRGVLTLDKLGKRGNQIVRLFQEPADIYFLQYGGKIDSSVYDKMETYTKGKNKKYYCIIDGTETARILKAYGYIK